MLPAIRHRCFWILLFNTAFIKIGAQCSGCIADARCAAMAGSSVLQEDVWSGYHNPAGLACIADFTAGLHYENRFSLPETGTRAFAAGLPVIGGTLSMGYSLFGYAHYYEGRGYLAFGKKIGENFSAGIQLNCLYVDQMADYGNLYAVIPAIGMRAQPLKRLYVGFYVFNPAGQTFYPAKDQSVPVMLQLGIGYLIADRIFFSLEAEKEMSEKQLIKAGFEFEPIDKLFLRLGVSTAEISRFAAGVGYTIRNFRIDFAISQHQWLGYTPYITLTYNRIGKKQAEE